ncbi:hypothetical protein JHK85_001484 [Glycine max]|nr:hypothetical protein JHK85_001484 [Glycine max]
MRKQHTSDASGALKYLHDICKKDPMMYVSYIADEGSRLQCLFWCNAESQLLYEVFGDVLAFDATYKKNKYLCLSQLFSGVNLHNQAIVLGTAITTDETEETYVWLLEQFLEAMKGKTPCSIITDDNLAMRNAITRVMPGVFHRLTIKLRVIDCKEMVMFSVYMVLKYCSGSVWHVSYCPPTVHFSCCCMRMQSIGLPCDYILAVLVCLNFTELPSSLVLNRWSKSATEGIKEKYPDSSMYWDSHLMGKYATLVQDSREVCEVAYRDQEEYDKMLHFLSNEHRRLKSKKNKQPCFNENHNQQDDNYDGILDPVVVCSN